MDFIKKNGAGLLLCLCIAIPAWLLGQAVPVVGGPVFSILIGMVLTLFWKNKTKVQPGIGFTSKKVLQYAVILLGFGLNLSEIAKVGAQSLPIIVSTIGTSLIVSFVLCKAMKVPAVRRSRQPLRSSVRTMRRSRRRFRLFSCSTLSQR